MSDIEINEKDRDNDDLGLSQTFVPDVPQEIFFPDELNAYLRDQVQVRILFLSYFHINRLHIDWCPKTYCSPL